MTHLLDTSICIYLINRKPPEVVQRLLTHETGNIGVSSITVAELRYGAAKSTYVEQNQLALDQFLLPLTVASFDLDAAAKYGVLRTDLEHRGKLIGPLDTLIGAHALALDLTLVTNNEREFRRVEGLRIENWVS